VILLLGIDPKEYKSKYSTDTYMLMFITTLFIIANLCKQPKCPTTNELSHKEEHHHVI
jgi:hypothetical protein